MDVVISIVRALLMVGFVAGTIFAVAALFMIVFGLATGIDKRVGG